MAAAAGSAPAPVGFKGRRAPVTPRRSEKWSSATGSHRASPACHAGVFTGSLADEIETDGFAPPMPGGRRVYSALHCYSATSRKMDLPRGRAPRCPRYQRGASLSTPWQSDGGSCRSRTDLARLMMPLPILLGQGTGQKWTAPDLRRVPPIKSRVHRCLCLRSERCGRRDLHAHAREGSEF